MTISWFCFFRNPDPSAALTAEDHRGLVALLRGCPGLVEGRVYTPATSHDPYSNDGPGPTLALQLEFATAQTAEAALRQHGYLQKLADKDFLPSVAKAATSQQALLSRKFPVPDPVVATPDGSTCTYLVEYDGPAEDENEWHRHYIDNHPAVMAKFPGIRQAEIYTPCTIVSMLPFPFALAMQRNKVVFDTPAALTAALNSPVREEMRKDFAKFPKFSGGNKHFPMHTVTVRGA